MRIPRWLFKPEDDPFRDLYTGPPESSADIYPAVPLPDSPTSPIMLAVRWASGDLRGEDMPAIAADLLEIGIDTPSIRRLAGELQVHCAADVEPLVSRMFHELGIKYPLAEKDAQLFVSRQIAREVIAGTRNAWAAASHLEIVVWGWVPGNDQLAAIFSIHDEIDWDASRRRPLSQLNKDLLEKFAKLASLSIPSAEQSLQSNK
jgi:hypothetical protein